MITRLKKNKFFLIFSVLACLLVTVFVVTKDVPFFWDAISKSVRASWVYDSGLKQFIVPTSINSGHPPLWISLLAFIWVIFGKSLMSARFLLLLVNLAVLYQIINLCKNNFVNGVSVLAVLLVCLDPTLMAQITSLNNDMLLLLFTLLSINALIKSEPILFAVALTGLLFTNLRGIYLFSAILILHFIYLRYKLISKNRHLFWAYGVSAICFMIFCIIQYRTLGWFIVTQNENFNAHRQPTELNNILVNSIVYIKSYLEFGRFIVFLVIIPLLFHYLKKDRIKSPEINRMGLAFVVIVIVLFIGMVPFSNPMGDRYFIIGYILATIVMINLLVFLKVKYKKLIVSIVILSFLSGHFWIYPATISQSWDSSLAYLRYYPLEKEMEKYLVENNLNTNDIGTRIRLNERYNATLKPANSFSDYANFNIETNNYILLSNIENYTKDDELLTVQNSWLFIKKFEDCCVFISLYKNPKM